MRGILFERVVVSYMDGKPHPVKPAKEPSKLLGRRTSASCGCPFNTGCLPLNHSGNPGVNGVSYRGVNGKRLAQARTTTRAKRPAGEPTAFLGTPPM
jgi:hypothetical protein